MPRVPQPHTPAGHSRAARTARGPRVEEGVDGYVPYAGDLDEGLAVTIAKLKTTMVSCGSTTLPGFRSTARLTLVSDQSFQESHANVTLRDAPATVA
ncbi:IMP dehydrogenase [Streptomyces sp. NPDC046870]|uniref:IMP dehydrogenase n=1 Tax=Streptomyces sp. NPDC046870 TaxID=3155135 RepID=UPI0034571041